MPETQPDTQPLYAQVQTAQQQGYTPDQILGYLSANRSDLAPKITQAQQQGHAPADIVNFLGTKPTPQQTPEPQESQPEGSAVSRFLGAVNPFPTLKRYLWDLPTQQSDDIVNQIGKGDYVGAVKTAAKMLPGVDFASDVVKAQAEQAKQAKQSLHQGDYVQAGSHALAAAVPMLGPIGVDAGQKIGAGDYAGALGDIAMMAGPEALKAGVKAVVPESASVTLRPGSALDPTEAASIKFADDNGIPLDTATRTGSGVARKAQTVLQNSLGSEGIAKAAATSTQEALKSTGAQLAQDVTPTATSPELAGQAAKNALAQVAKEHGAAASAAYDALRAIEADPKNARLVENNGGEQSITSKTPAASNATPLVGTRDSAAATPGSATNIPVPGEDTVYPAHYEVRELSEIQPSHDGLSFEANPDYPHVNDRDYTKPEAKARVIDQAQKLDPARILTDNSDATNGPPILDQDNNVLGGNSRAMMLQRVYASADGSAADLYRSRLAAKAADFGIDPEQVKAMKEPVLVRVVDSAPDPQTAITDFNKTGTAPLNQSEQAISDARRVSPETVQHISNQIEAQGEGGTLPQALDGQRGPEVLNRLVNDGVMTEQEKSQYLSRGLVTAEGKRRVGRMMAGRLFDSTADIDAASPELRGKIERIAGPLSRLEGHTPEWDLTPKVKDAIAMLSEAKQRGASLDDLTSQADLFGAGSHDPETLTIAKALQGKGSDAAAAFRDFADAAAPSHPSAPLSMFGTPDRAQSFADAFEKPEAAGSHAAVSTAVSEEAPQPEAAAPVAKAPAAKTAASPAPTVRSVPLPVDLQEGKVILKQVYDRMTKLMPIAQQRASAGLVAIQNILDSPRVISASEADENLSALKAAQREVNTPQAARLLNMAVDQLSRAVDKAVAAGGPEAVSALKKGRAATVAKYAAEDTLGKLRDEPVQAFQQLLHANDANINLLREVADKVPGAVPAIGRAVLENLTDKAFAEAGQAKPGSALNEYRKLGPETKKLLFGFDGAKQIDSFLTLAKRVAENPNPSGTAYVSILAGEIGMLVHSPHWAVPYLIGKNLVARMLFNPRSAAALANGLKIPVRAGATAALTAGQILSWATNEAKQLPPGDAPKQLTSGQ